jgi:hypothetical protein
MINDGIIILEVCEGSVGLELFSQHLPVENDVNEVNLKSWHSLEIATSNTFYHTTTFISYLSRLH